MTDGLEVTPEDVVETTEAAAVEVVDEVVEAEAEAKAPAEEKAPAKKAAAKKAPAVPRRERCRTG